MAPRYRDLRSRKVFVFIFHQNLATYKFHLKPCGMLLWCALVRCCHGKNLCQVPKNPASLQLFFYIASWSDLFLSPLSLWALCFLCLLRSLATNHGPFAQDMFVKIFHVVPWFSNVFGFPVIAGFWATVPRLTENSVKCSPQCAGWTIFSSWIILSWCIDIFICIDI